MFKVYLISPGYMPVVQYVPLATVNSYQIVISFCGSDNLITIALPSEHSKFPVKTHWYLDLSEFESSVRTSEVSTAQSF